MSPRDILFAARALIAMPERWTRVVVAKDARGVYVEATDPGACAWCVIGALECVSPGEIHGAIQLITAVLPEHASCSSDSPALRVGRWNDAPGRTHAEVLTVLDRAIEIARAA